MNSDDLSLRAYMIKAVNDGLSEDEFLEMFHLNSRATARLYMYKIRKGIITLAPPNPRRPRHGRRGRAFELYAEGKDILDVMAATGLKRATASVYRWEFGRMQAHQAELDKLVRDPLCE